MGRKIEWFISDEDDSVLIRERITVGKVNGSVTESSVHLTLKELQKIMEDFE